MSHGAFAFAAARRAGWRVRLVRLARGGALAWYLSAAIGLWLLAIAAAALTGWRMEGVAGRGAWLAAIVWALLAGAAGQFAITAVNWMCTLIVPPRALPRLNFAAGIPGGHRALVAVPVMLSSEGGVRRDAAQLECRFLANRDENLFFALLTDFADAPRETMPGDRRLLRVARSEIRRLNRRYGRGRTRFYLLHRPRRWNEQEGVWMGEERKRGKLAALNRLVLDGDRGPFSATVGNLDLLSTLRYVITLDADTHLPRDAARRLVGCMAHPLNRPRLDPRTKRVMAGYAILQPRVGATIADAARSRYSRLSACDPGIDPYTRQTSDVYQDLFGEGSFIGKGIYDVRAFSEALAGRFPDNRVLSHDLIEGCFARSGVVSDVEVFEGLPARFLADMARRHRWIRGDWQIAAWLWNRVPAGQGARSREHGNTSREPCSSGVACSPLPAPCSPLAARVPNSLDALARWKIFDNLRRSLVPPMLLSFLLAAWALSPQLAGFCTVMALLLTSSLPVAIGALGLLRKPPEKRWTLHVKEQGGRVLKVVACEAFSWCVLPYVAHRHLDAIIRTLYRLRISHRGLLEWMPASEAEARCSGRCRDHYAAMWACVAAAAIAALALAVGNPHALFWAGPLLAAWSAGPLLAWWTSRPLSLPGTSRTRMHERQVRRWARQTWHYFERFAGKQENWLPPDNVQWHRPARDADPQTDTPAAPAVAARTSPTNIGMGLLSALAACDFGFLSGTALLARTSKMLHTVARLERWRGHLFNWYDTRTLQPLEPRYVSSVDSGNLWGALTVLAAGLDELRDRPVVPRRFLEGLHDTLEAIATVRRGCWPAPAPDNPMDNCLAALRAMCAAPSPRSARQADELLCQIRSMAATLATCASGNSPDLQAWAATFVQQAADMHQELLRSAFWLRVTAPAILRAIDKKALVACAADFVALFRQLDRLDRECTLSSLPRAARKVAELAGRLCGAIPQAAPLAALGKAAEYAARAADGQLSDIVRLSSRCRKFCRMDFRRLFNPRRKLLSIGFLVSAARGRGAGRDNCYYDLLASEARLTSFLAVSDGQLPPEHWFALGRPMTLADGSPALLSWSGSMFEYLMPALLMPSFPGTLLGASCAAAVRRQMRYARTMAARFRIRGSGGLPWGISESCYHRTDEKGVYQYCAHGVPGLGLAPDVGERLVVAPYASALAMMVAPREAAENLARLEREGYLSPHGFYDAIDFTPPAGDPTRCAGAPDASIVPAVCRTVMAHHSGMTLLALDNVLFDAPMRRRLLKNPACAAHDLLLQERMPGAQWSATRPMTTRMKKHVETASKRKTV